MTPPSCSICKKTNCSLLCPACATGKVATLSSELHRLKTRRDELVKVCQDHLAANKVRYDTEKALKHTQITLDTLQCNLRIVQTQLRQVQQKVDAQRNVLRQRASKLLHRIKLLDSDISSLKYDEGLHARLVLLTAKLEGQQYMALSEISHVFPLVATVGEPDTGAMALAKVPLPSSIDEYINKDSSQRKRISNSIGQLILMIDILARLIESPSIFQGKYCGTLSVISANPSFWESSPNSQEQAFALYIKSSSNTQQVSSFDNALKMVMRSIGMLTHAYYGPEAAAVLPVQLPPYSWLAILSGTMPIPDKTMLGVSLQHTQQLEGGIYESSVQARIARATDDMDDDWEEVHAAGYGHPGEEARSFPHTVANTLVSISNRARQYLGY